MIKLNDVDSPRSILLVQDSGRKPCGLAAWLEKSGYVVERVDCASHAAESLASRPQPGVILVDSAAAHQCLRLRDTLGNLIPLITLLEAREQLEPLSPSGNVNLVQKPIDLRQLHAALRRFGLIPRPQILVVDDQPGVLRMMSAVLGHFGFIVHSASSGREAVELYRRNHRSIGAVLLDVQMPALDGPATLAALRQIDEVVVCCFMSGDLGKYAVEDLMALRAHGFLPKPFVSIPVLHDTIWSALCRLDSTGPVRCRA